MSLTTGNLIQRALTTCSFVFCNKKVALSRGVDSEDDENISKQDGFPGLLLTTQRTQEKGKEKKSLIPKHFVAINIG